MNDDIQEDLVQDELEVLKARATLLGIKFHPSSGVDSLKEKIRVHMSETPAETSAPVKVKTVVEETTAQLNTRLKREASKLVRCRITCMNPNKKEWEGELFTVGNAVVGTHKAFIPFDTDWHVRQIIFNQLRDRQCQIFFTVKENGRKVRRGKLIKEFSIDLLPDLTEKELKDLAQRQAMAAGTSN